MSLYRPQNRKLLILKGNVEHSYCFWNRCEILHWKVNMFAYVLCKQRMFYVWLPNALKLVKQGGMVLGNKEGICGLLIATEKVRNERSERTMFPTLPTLIL